MKWYTAIGCKGEDGEGQLLVKMTRRKCHEMVYSNRNEKR